MEPKKKSIQSFLAETKEYVLLIETKQKLRSYTSHLFITNTVWPMRARLTTWLERFHGTQKEEYSILSGWDQRICFIYRDQTKIYAPPNGFSGILIQCCAPYSVPKNKQALYLHIFIVGELGWGMWKCGYKGLHSSLMITVSNRFAYKLYESIRPYLP